jgi:hypothetical protein
MDSNYIYSEPGEVVYLGNLNITTVDLGKLARVTITRDYSDQYNITYKNLEESKILTKSSVPYKLVVTNEGQDSSDRMIINLDLI